VRLHYLLLYCLLKRSFCLSLCLILSLLVFTSHCCDLNTLYLNTSVDTFSSFCFCLLIFGCYLVCVCANLKFNWSKKVFHCHIFLVLLFVLHTLFWKLHCTLFCNFVSHWFLLNTKRGVYIYAIGAKEKSILYHCMFYRYKHIIYKWCGNKKLLMMFKN